VKGNIGSIIQAEIGAPILRWGKKWGKINSLDLDIVGIEAGVNGIRVSTVFGGIRLFGKD